MTVAVPDIPRAAPRSGLLTAQKLVLPFTLPGCNELLHARGQVRRGSNAYADWKRDVQPVVAALARKQLKPISSGVWLRFAWFEADKRRDPLDVPGLAKKLIVDALCEHAHPEDPQPRAHIIHCDGWHCIAGGTDYFAIDKASPRIEVVLYGVRR